MPTRPAPRLVLSLAASAAALAALAALPARAEEEAAPAEEAAAAGVVRGTVAAAKGGEPTVVFLRDVPGDQPARVRSAELKGGALTGKVIVVAVGDTVKLVNADGQAHLLASPEAGLDLGLLDKGEVRGQPFLRPGAYSLRCALHKELLGWIFVAPGPQATLADKAGAWEIRDVPAGKWSVSTWTPGAAKVADAGTATGAGEVAAVAAAPAARKGAAPAPAPRKEAKPETGSIRGTVKAEPARFLEETVVYLKQVPGSWAPKKVAMDQRKMKFIPHVLPVVQGDTVRFLNNDGLAHNVFTNDGEGYNLGMFPDGEERPYTFKRQGVYSQLCNIHPDMLAFVFVAQNPWAAVVDASGRYELKNVPPGQYTLAIWNSHLTGADKQVIVERGGVVDASFTVKR